MLGKGRTRQRRIRELMENLAAARPTGGRVSRAIFSHVKEAPHDTTATSIRRYAGPSESLFNELREWPHDICFTRGSPIHHRALCQVQSAGGAVHEVLSI
jgi:hypothetical protein